MSDLIDRQAAIDAASYECGELRGVFGRIEERLKALPSAQPEIIRCKDCKHNRRLECPFGITVFDAPKDDEFCSRAERRPDE